MDHVGILKNAFHTTWRYRALWILGFLWALVGGTGAGYGFPGSTSNYNFGGRRPQNLPFGGDLGANIGLVVGLLVLACGMFLILGILALVLRYTLQAGVYRSLHALDAEGVAPGVKRGIREGWNRRTWRVVLQDLLVGILMALASLLTLALALSPLLLLIADNRAVKAVGIAAAVGLGLVWLLLFIIAATAVSVLSQLWWRAAVVGDETALDAIGSGWRLARRYLGDVAIIWLLMLGAGLLWGLIMIPVMLLLGGLAAVFAAGPGFLIYQTTHAVWPALLWGVPVGLVIFVVPLVFLGGLYLIFQASVWNQVYDQLRARIASSNAPSLPS